MGDELQEIADSIGQYVTEKYVKPLLALSVSYFRATVVEAAQNGRITVQRPYDSPMALPYVTSAADLLPGQQCLVLVFGTLSNAFVLGDVTLNNL